MKAEARREWVELVKRQNEENANPYHRYCLCSYCKYVQVHLYDEEPEGECNHGLEAVSENMETVEKGADCWGFRPLKAREGGVHHAD